MAFVLCTGVDDSLLRTRKLILEHAGHRVITAKTVPEIDAACERHPIQVVVVGQAIPRTEKLRIFGIVRAQCPAAKILELYRLYEDRVLPSADDWLEVPADVPPSLAEKVGALASPPDPGGKTN